MKNESAELHEARMKWLSFEAKVGKWLNRARENIARSQTSEERMFYLEMAFGDYRAAYHWYYLAKQWKAIVDSLS